MYLLFLLPILTLSWLLFSRFLFAGKVTGRPLALLGALVALSALAQELLLPGSFTWLVFHPVSLEELAPLYQAHHGLAVVGGLLCLLAQKKKGLRQWVLAAVLGVALDWALGVGLIANVRIDYPYHLEWLEGSVLDSVVVLRNGEPLYRPPDVDFIPFLYTPFYMRLAALSPYLDTSPYLPGRMISLFMSCWTGLLIFGVVARSTSKPWLALLLCATFVATYRWTGHWFDTHRVDPTFLALTLTGMTVVAFGNGGVVRMALGALLFSLAVYTKQPAGLAALAAPVWLACAGRGRDCLLICLFGALWGGGLLLFELLGSGWIAWEYMVRMVFVHPPLKHLWDNVVVERDLLGVPFIFLLLICVDTLLAAARHASLRRLVSRPWLWFTSALIVLSVLMRVKHGGYANCLLPLAAALTITAGLWFRERMAGWSGSAGAPPPLPLLLVLITLVFLDPTQTPRYNMIPTDEDLLAGRRLERYVRERPGRVIITCVTHMAYRARRETSYNGMARDDWQTLHDGRFPESIVEAVRARRVDTIILNQHVRELYQAMGDDYRCSVNPLGWSPTAFRPVTGWRGRPTFFCELKS